MSWLSDAFKKAKKIVKKIDPIGSAIADKTESAVKSVAKKVSNNSLAKYVTPVTYTAATAVDKGLPAAAKTLAAKVALPGTSLLIRDPYRFLDYSAYGAGDFISPRYTDPNNKGWESIWEGLRNFGGGTGGNKIYDVAGPIAALITGGYFAAGALGGGSGAAAGSGTGAGTGGNALFMPGAASGSLSVPTTGVAGAATGANVATGSSLLGAAGSQAIPAAAGLAAGGAGLASGAGGAGAAGTTAGTAAGAAAGTKAAASSWGFGDWLNLGLGVGSTLYSGYQAEKASDAANTASNNAIAAMLKMYEQGRADLAPWREAGGQAVKDYASILKAGPGEFKATEQPGYQFGWNELAQQYLGAQSAKGKRYSGETAKGITKYAEDYASTGFDNFLARYYQKLNAYSNLAGLGQTSAGQTASSANQTGTNVANQLVNIGNNESDKYSIQAGLLNNSLNNYLNYTMYQKMGVV